MKKISTTIKKSIWFTLEVIGIFTIVQLIRYAFGNWQPISIALALLIVAVVLFLIAFLIAQYKDNNKHKPSSRAFTNLTV